MARGPPWGSLTHLAVLQLHPARAAFYSLFRAFAGQRPDEIENRPADARVRNAHKGLVQFKALAARKKVDDVAIGGPLGKAVFDHAAWRLIVEKIDGNTQNLTEFVQPAGADTIDALFVLLHLLEGKTELLAQLLLTHAQQHAPQPHTRAHMHVHGIGTAGIVLFWLRMFRHFLFVWHGGPPKIKS